MKKEDFDKIIKYIKYTNPERTHGASIAVNSIYIKGKRFKADFGGAYEIGDISIKKELTRKQKKLFRKVLSKLIYESLEIEGLERTRKKIEQLEEELKSMEIDDKSGGLSLV